MILDPQHKDAFEDYREPLKSLEEAFRKSGITVTFFAFEAPLGNKLIQILRGKTVVKTVCIEGDSPAQAIKDVAQAVKL
jgi:nicotinamidase-related amidase